MSSSSINPPTWIDDLLAAVSTHTTPSPSAILDILARGGNDDVRAKLGRTEWEGCCTSPLHLAARRGHAKAVQLLVEAGVPVDCVEKFGYQRLTALHKSVFWGEGEAVKMLLDLGADPDLPCRYAGRVETPMDVAKRNGRRLLEILQEHKEKLAGKSRDKEAFQAVIAKVKVLESDLERASEVDRKIEAEVEAERKRVLEHKKRIDDLRMDKGYLTSFQKKRRMEEIDEVGVMKRTLLASSVQDDDDLVERGLACPVCFKIPPKAFSCLECNNFLCEECLKKVVVCPACRADFTKKPPQRNICTERVLLATIERSE